MIIKRELDVTPYQKYSGKTNLMSKETALLLKFTYPGLSDVLNRWMKYVDDLGGEDLYDYTQLHMFITILHTFFMKNVPYSNLLLISYQVTGYRVINNNVIAEVTYTYE